MNKKIMSSSLLFALLSSMLIIVGCVEEKKQIPQGAILQFETYGGFVSDEHARQAIIIGPEKITYIVYSNNNQVTESYQKKIKKEEYTALLDLLNEKRFLDMQDKYSPPKITVADTGDAKLTVNFDNTSKIVILEPYFLEYYPDNVRIVFEAMQSYTNKIYDLSEEELKNIAEEWIRNAPTYSYDGQNLNFVKMDVLETYPITYALTYSFTSGGYGNRSKIAGPQVVSKHNIIIGIQKGKIIGAVIDGTWDELTQDYYKTTIKFQPLQCAKTPWRKWYDSGNIKFIKEPSEEELITAYYDQVYGITITNFKMVSSDNLVAAVCGNPEPYYFTAKVRAVDRKKMFELSWKASE